jgi:hypothetical protein
MTSGTFQVGETVIGNAKNWSLEELSETSARITFRVAQSNHREGAYDAPTQFSRKSIYK